MRSTIGLLLFCSFLLVACGNESNDIATTSGVAKGHFFNKPYVCVSPEKNDIAFDRSFYHPQKALRIDLYYIYKKGHIAIFTPTHFYSGFFSENDSLNISNLDDGVLFNEVTPNNAMNLYEKNKKNCMILDDLSIFEIVESEIN